MRLTVRTARAPRGLAGVCVFWSFALQLIAAVSPPEAAFRITPEPIPSWVEPVTWTVLAAANPSRSPGEVLLSDAQDELTPQGCAYYYRNVIRLLNAEGVRQNAEQKVVFSPEYQRVSWHTLSLTRGSEVLDRLATAQFKQLQRELDLEAQIVTGRTTLATVLEDVRVGDIIEIAYTIHDTNPVMRGHMSARHYVGSGYPTQHARIQVRTPISGLSVKPSVRVPPGTRGLPDALFRPSALRAAIQENHAGEQRVFLWESKGQPALQFDEMLPASAAPYYPMVQFSTFRTWTEVAEWAEPLFALSPDLPESVQSLLAGWKKDPEVARRIEAAVKWVQNEIRYFAMAVGPHNLKPRTPAEVCASRFGDCKDKSLLLAGLLRQLGVEAWPALVNTQWQGELRELSPSPFAFNHAIVAYRVNHQLQWIDPTIKGQRATAGTWSLPPYRCALILRRDESDLTDIATPAQKEPDTVTFESIRIDPQNGEATVELQVTLRGLQADGYRQQLEAFTSSDLSKRWFNFIGRFYRRAEEIDPPTVKDDGVSQPVVIQTRYRVPEFMRTEKGETSVGLYAYALRALLEPPTSQRRHWPYALAQDRFVRHRVEITLPFEAGPEQHPQTIVGHGVEYRVDKGLAGRRFVMEHDLRITAGAVPAENMPRFGDTVDEIMAALGATLRPPARKPEATAAPAASGAATAAGDPR